MSGENHELSFSENSIKPAAASSSNSAQPLMPNPFQSNNGASPFGNPFQNGQNPFSGFNNTPFPSGSFPQSGAVMPYSGQNGFPGGYSQNGGYGANQGGAVQPYQQNPGLASQGMQLAQHTEQAAVGLYNAYSNIQASNNTVKVAKIGREVAFHHDETLVKIEDKKLEGQKYDINARTRDNEENRKLERDRLAQKEASEKRAHDLQKQSLDSDIAHRDKVTYMQYASLQQGQAALLNQPSVNSPVFNNVPNGNHAPAAANGPGQLPVVPGYNH